MLVSKRRMPASVMPENAMRASMEDMQLPVCRCTGRTGLACLVGTVLKVRLRRNGLKISRGSSYSPYAVPLVLARA